MPRSINFSYVFCLYKVCYVTNLCSQLPSKPKTYNHQLVIRMRNVASLVTKYTISTMIANRQKEGIASYIDNKAKDVINKWTKAFSVCSHNVKSSYKNKFPVTPCTSSYAQSSGTSSVLVHITIISDEQTLKEKLLFFFFVHVAYFSFISFLLLFVHVSNYSLNGFIKKASKITKHQTTYWQYK